MPEFDIPAAIRKLAEAELACPKAGGDRDLGPDVSAWVDVCVAGRVGIGVDEYGYGRYAPCPECKGTGRIVPFAALRVECPNMKLRHSVEGQRYGCGVCGNRLWIPEPDVEKACWRILKVLADNTFGVSLAVNEEVVIRAALTWLVEQPK